MTQFVIANNVNTQLAAAASNSATVLTLAGAANLPTLSAGQVMPLVLNDAATGLQYEVVYVTAISGVSLTVQRAQEGTGALTWNLGDYAYCAPTQGTVATLYGNPLAPFFVGPATLSNQAAQLAQVQSAIYSYIAAPDSGAVDALSITLSPAPTALSAGMQVTALNVAATNTAAATLNLNGLGAKPIVLPSGAALSGGEIPGGAAATFVYTGASWMLQTRQPANGVPYMNFSQIDALASDQGPIICTDMGGYLYKWTTSPYFTGYRNVRCGNLPETFAATPRAWELATIGGVWSMSDPKQKRLIAWFQEQGLVVPSGSWLAGQGMISDLGSGNWKGIDLQNMFFRKAGTDADTANAAPAGTYKSDTLKAHTHTLATYIAYVFGGGSASGMGVGSSTPTSSTGTAETAPKHTRTAPVILI